MPFPMTDELEQRDELIRGLRAEIERLRAAILATRTLVSEAALTGFNCKDGDWAERLFANQATLTAALKIERQKARQQFQST